VNPTESQAWRQNLGKRVDRDHMTASLVVVRQRQWRTLAIERQQLVHLRFVGVSVALNKTTPQGRRDTNLIGKHGNVVAHC